MTKFQVLIGRNVPIDILGLVLGVPAKVDTGAYRSVIHASNIEVIENNGSKKLKATLLGHPCSPVKYAQEFTEFENVTIVNSFGNKEERYLVQLKVKIASKVFKASFTLADRSNNFFPVLLGRTLLTDRFVVDVSKTSVERAKLRKQFGIKVADGELD